MDNFCGHIYLTSVRQRALIIGKEITGNLEMFKNLTYSKQNIYLSVLKILAISGTNGSSGLGSQRREQTDSNTLLIVKAGDHCDLKMSRQIEPLELMFGW